MKSEKTLQKEILDYLKDIGAYSIKTMTSNRKGIPDILCCFEGQFVAIEVKGENKDFRSVSPLQKTELKKINMAGGFGCFTNNLNYIKQIFNSNLIVI